MYVLHANITKHLDYKNILMSESMKMAEKANNSWDKRKKWSQNLIQDLFCMHISQKN